MNARDRIVAANLSTRSARERLGGVLRHHAAELGRRLLRRIPGAAAGDRARVQPLRSQNLGLRRWVRAAYGTAGKPASLAEVPWDYVRENEAKIPFLGLRESWYPALASRELRHNAAVPVALLGDALVLFRDAEGRPRALEDRCPHRSALLSLGQVGIVAPGTLTCRYHGMTFDAEGECIAVLSDGPESPACGKVRARPYPTEELGGVVWVYMGEREPRPVLDALPHAREVFQGGEVFVDRGEWPFSYLAAVDNDVDLAHPACLHRTCAPFSDQKLWGRIGVEELACGGTRVRWRDGDERERPHAGALVVDGVDWHLPNIAYFPPNDLAGPGSCGYFWAVPRDVGSCSRWFLFGGRQMTGRLGGLMRLSVGAFFGRPLVYPGSPASCSDGADAAMMASQGRVPRWDRERLLRTDVAVSAVRRKLQKAHVEERAGRAPSPAELALRVAPPGLSSSGS